jgi:glycosyltransferase involved in cell wall biosynthesis
MNDTSDITFSVVIPVKDGAGTISRAVKSAMQQTKPPVEVIVVDDGSSDSSAILAEGAGAVVARLASSGGRSRARNLGVELSAGSHIALLDADDYWEPTHLSEAARGLGPDRKDKITVGRRRTLRCGRCLGSVEQESDLSELSPRSLLMNNPVTLSAVCLRRQLFIDLGGFHESYSHGEDLDLWIRACMFGTEFVRSAGTVVYQTRNSTVPLESIKLALEARQAIAKHYTTLLRLSGKSSREINRSISLDFARSFASNGFRRQAYRALLNASVIDFKTLAMTLLPNATARYLRCGGKCRGNSHGPAEDSSSTAS